MLLFGVALLVLRVAFLLAGLDPAEDRVMAVLGESAFVWPHGPERPLYDREELYTAAAAEAMRGGLAVPSDAYRFTPYGGGSLVIARLLVPLFALFGASIFTLKSVGLVVSVGGGLAWFAAVRRALGLRAAFCFGLLYAFAPSAFLRTSLIAKGDHAESMAIVGLFFWILTRALFPRSPRAPLLLALAGAVAGLGVSISYSVLPAILGVVAFLIVWTRLRPIRLWLHGAAGFAVGLVPWAIEAASLGSAALRVYSQPLWSISSATAIQRRATALVNEGLLAGYDLGPRWFIEGTAAAAWTALAVVAIVFLIRMDAARRALALAAVAGIVATLLAYVLRAPDTSVRYMVAGYPCLFVAAAWFASERNGRADRGAWLYAAVVAFGLAAQLGTVFGSSFVALRQPPPATDRELLGEVVGAKLSGEALAALPEPVAPYFYRGLGRRALAIIPREQWTQAAALAADDSLAVWEGMGTAWAELGHSLELGAHAAHLSDPAREALVAGVARYGEVFWARVFDLGGREAVARALTSLAPTEARVLQRSCARTFAVLATQEARVGIRPAAAAVLDLRGIVPEELLAEGAGYSFYRGSVRAVGDRVWTPPTSAWTHTYFARLASPDGPVRRGFLQAASEDSTVARLEHARP